MTFNHPTSPAAAAASEMADYATYKSEDRAADTTTANTYQNKLSYTTPVLVSGAKYEVDVRAAAGNSDSNTQIYVRTVASGSLSESREKKLFCAPAGDSTQLTAYTEKFVLTASSDATAQIDLDYKSSVSGKTSRIEGAIITVRTIP